MAQSLRIGGMSTALCGLVNRKLRWSLSWRGWVALAVLSLTSVAFAFREIHPFLAVTDRIETETMVVEGWMDQTDLVQAVEEFKHGHYRRVFTTGGPVHGTGSYVSDYSTSAYLAAQELIALGLPKEAIQSVPSHVRDRDRTYSAAVALHEWIREHHENVPSIVVVTESAHARRSRLLFEKAFCGDSKIGVIALSNVDYDGQHWWRYSEGVKDVLSEGTAYLYARFLFRPHRRSQPVSG